MSEDALPPSLQESLLALLAFNDKYGTLITAQVKPEHFDAPYQRIATKLLAYRHEYGRPPGHAHLDDIFDLGKTKGDQAQREWRLLAGINELGKGLNAEYVATRVQDFIRKQTLKSAIMRAGELYQSGGDDHVAQIEQVLYGALRARQPGLAPGLRLSDTARSLAFLDRREADFPLGIPVLDRTGFGASYKELLLYIGPKGSGKSFFCVHMGRQGLIHRAKVLHVSLEMSQESIAGRYCQSLFGVGSRNTQYPRTSFEFDELKKLVGWETTRQKPKLNFNNPDIRKYLSSKITQWGLRLGSLMIKDFPSGQLTVSQLNAYLDYLEQFEKFIPQLVVCDYPDLMKQDPQNLRISTGRTFVDLRGMAKERNFALVAPTQGGRDTIEAKHVRSKNVSEDISKVFTADNVLTYQQTKAEKRLGLARLSVEHARNTEGGQQIVISQAYPIGQFVLESAYMSNEYWKQMKGEDDGSEE